MRRVIQAAKSLAGNRVIRLLDLVANPITQYHEWTQNNNVRPIDGFDSFIFLTRKGRLLTSAGVNNALKSAAEAFNIEQAAKGSSMRSPSLSCHWLRRTFDTRLCEMRVSLKVVWYLTGRQDVNMTANVYTTVQENLAASEMLKLVKENGEFHTTFLQQTYRKLSQN